MTSQKPLICSEVVARFMRPLRPPLVRCLLPGPARSFRILKLNRTGRPQQRGRWSCLATAALPPPTLLPARSPVLSIAACVFQGRSGVRRAGLSAPTDREQSTRAIGSDLFDCAARRKGTTRGDACGETTDERAWQSGHRASGQRRQSSESLGLTGRLKKHDRTEEQTMGKITTSRQ